MDNTHLHLLLTHFPIIGTMLGMLILWFGIWKKNLDIQIVSLVVIVVMSLIAIPVFLTGEPAEESVENLPGVLESIIEEHEESAELAFWVMMATGTIALVSIFFIRVQKTLASTFIIITLLMTVFTSILMARTGYLGGQIRHTEIRGDATIAQPGDQGGEDDD